MEIALTATIIAPFLLLVGWAVARNSSRYRRDRRQVLSLLEGVLRGEVSARNWILFVGYPISHDPELEAIRRRCLLLQEGDDEHPPARSGIGGYLFDREGRQRLEAIVEDLRQLIASEPYRRSF